MRLSKATYNAVQSTMKIQPRNCKNHAKSYTSSNEGYWFECVGFSWATIESEQMSFGLRRKVRRVSGDLMSVRRSLDIADC